MVGTDADRRFYFRAAPERLAGATAANLSELETELARCERAVLRHHCQLHDFSRWVANVFHDRPLAETLRPIEATIGAASPAAVVEAGRLELIAALQARTPG
jgi:hypothetical protein